MKSNELAVAWLKRAISNLEKAKIGKISEALFCYKLKALRIDMD
jgi:hypothetical protein